MSDVTHRIEALAAEYIEYVDMMRSGTYDGAEYREISAQRTLVHDELLLMTGLTRENTVMYTWCKNLLRKDAFTV